jgi:hypothetical protein
MVFAFPTKMSWFSWLGRMVNVLLVGLLLIFGITLVLYLAEEIGGPVLYRLPGDYRGWAGIRYDDPLCAPLSKEGWYTVIPIGSNGWGCTSHSVPGGWRYVRYEYSYSDGRRRKLVGPNERFWSTGVTGPQIPHIEAVFVGSKQEMERAWSGQHDIMREMKQKS